MTWATPPNFVAGNTLPEADLDTLSDDLNFLAGSTGASVDTSQTTTSTSYTDLATAGPAVTVLTATKAIVIVTASLAASGPAYAFMGFAVSGATTRAAGDLTALQRSSTASGELLSAMFWVDGLTAGSNIFTAKYRVGGGTGTFLARHIIVIPVP